MKLRHRFTWEADWRTAPMAYWVHIPVADALGAFDPPAPLPVPHQGHRFLRVEFGQHELVFSSPAQFQHLIDVLSTSPLPTSRQLSAARGDTAGPNSHWLSRFPADLKSPRTREALVRQLKVLRKELLLSRPSAKQPVPSDWPTLVNQ
jgi:hypothetical protein